jgi:hypothetical protein
VADGVEDGVLLGTCDGVAEPVCVGIGVAPGVVLELGHSMEWLKGSCLVILMVPW